MEKQNLRVVVVGGVASGATAAAKCRRENEQAEITLFEKGSFISFSNCALPMFIGGEIKQREKLFVTSPEALYKKYRIHTKVLHEVVKINREQKVVTVKNLANGETYDQAYDKLILSTGAGAIVPPLAGVKSKNIFLVKTVPDTDSIKPYLEKLPQAKKVMIMGGGFIGLECAEAFKRINMDVTVVEMASHILPPFDEDMASFFQIHLEHAGVKIITGDGVKGFDTNKNELGEDVAYQAVLQSGKVEPFDLCVLSIGVRPEIQLAKDCGLKIGETGGVEVNDYLQSSDPSIYVAGDATEVTNLITGKKMRLALATSANKQGGVAGTNVALGNQVTFPGVLGTCIVESLGIIAAMTGLTEVACQKLGIEYIVSIAHPSSHISAYPGAKALHMKLITEKSTNRILGCQIVGEDGVDKRIDVIATAIHAKMTAEDLTKLDLSYAPQFSSARSPENIIGSIATTAFLHKVDLMTVKQAEEEIQKASQSNTPLQVVDVRDLNEIQATGHLSKYQHIPYGKLREELHTLNPEVKTLVMCQSGLRSYLSCRILIHNGFKSVFSITGGALSAPLSMIH